MDNNAIILAAGKGTRMKSNLYKVLHTVLGKPMLKHVVDNLNKANVKRKVVVVGHKEDEVRNVLKDVEFVVQEEQLGTGHAVKMAESQLENEEGTTIVICGDTPLITSETINNLISYHNENSSNATVLTSLVENPTNYGRIIRDEDNSLMKIVEHKDASPKEKLIKEINTGTYCFNNKLLFKSINKIKKNNVQNEYYLTDVIEIIKQEYGKVNAFMIKDFSETIGINDRKALARANQVLKNRVNNKLMDEGITIIDPETTYISVDTIIGKDTIIYPNTIINGSNIIGKGCVIGPNTELENVEIGNDVKIKHSLITDSIVKDNTSVGPFAHFRNNAIIGENVRIGNFVEVKKSIIGNNSNAAHLAYIGDAEIGNKVNMGCGSITVNYDGKNKHKTKIGNNVFVGCNSNLLAPITIGDNAYIGAGSTITNDVPTDSLAIAREKQITKIGYAKKYKK